MSMPDMVPNERDIRRASKRRKRISMRLAIGAIAIVTGLALGSAIVALV